MVANKNTVLITTSGTGNRLGNLTKYTNKSLVRIGKKPAISYIIESYPDNTEFVITTGYYGNHVKQYLKLAYPEKTFIFCDVDKFEGKGSSLLYSMYCAKNNLQKPFIFHACDTILSQPLAFKSDIKFNWCASASTTRSEHYRTHKLIEGLSNIIGIDEKGSDENIHAHIGISKINDYELFWKISDDLLSNFVEDQSLSDCHVINKMIENGCKFESVFSDSKNWFDIGNMSSLNHARENISDKFQILDKDDESIFILKDYVIKFFYNKKIVTNRVNRLNHLKLFGPKLIDSTENFYKYEYIIGKEASYITSTNDFKHLLNNLQKYWTLIEDNSSFIEKTQKFYFDKTHERATQFLTSHKIEDKNIIINGINVPKLSILLEQIPVDLITTSKKYHFHGDCVLDNIIITPQGDVKFIDWRQDFYGEIDGGDIYYDLGKLLHSLTLNHNLISKNLFNYKESEINGVKNIEIDILRKSSHVEFEKIFIKFVSDNQLDMKKLNIIKSLIWINMSPLHHYPFNYFLYYYGLLNLNSVINDKSM
jgi:NDP-sugar pyrophosphorylase family protein/thiamine kinase-like enzyme